MSFIKVQKPSNYIYVKAMKELHNVDNAKVYLDTDIVRGINYITIIDGNIKTQYEIEGLTKKAMHEHVMDAIEAFPKNRAKQKLINMRGKV